MVIVNTSKIKLKRSTDSVAGFFIVFLGRKTKLGVFRYIIYKDKCKMNNIKEFFEKRTSVRRYEREPISEEAMSTIYAAIQNTPTSYNGQQFSVIDVTDQELKEKLYEIIGQKQIKTCNHFMLFCADYNKIGLLANGKGLEMPEFNNTLDGVFVGVIDAALAMSSAYTAARAYGLGCCCIGYARTANPAKIAEVLNLPKGVFVVCGLSIGVPREAPDVKPKQSKSIMIHDNVYSSEGLLERLVNYDSAITEYNKTRSGTQTDNDWVSHMLDYYSEAMNYNMLEYLKAQGFDIKK